MFIFSFEKKKKDTYVGKEKEEIKRKHTGWAERWADIRFWIQAVADIQKRIQSFAASPPPFPLPHPSAPYSFPSQLPSHPFRFDTRTEKLPLELAGQLFDLLPPAIHPWQPHIPPRYNIPVTSILHPHQYHHINVHIPQDIVFF